MTAFKVCLRSFGTTTAILLCSGALSAQVPNDLTEPDFPLATPVEAVQGQPEALTLKGKTDYFLKSAFSAEALGRVALTTSIGQIGGASEEWGTGSSAYGRRLGARYASHFVTRGVRYGVGALHGEDPRFYRSGKEGFKARAGFVLSRTFLVQMDDGATSIAAGRIAGALAGNTLQSYMRENPKDALRNGLTNAGISIGTDTAVRMVREFWPDIKKAFRR
ncbi:MAG TPA: hypothetical protein VER03_03870 [Bryobacteraceae bacterium]|nr:hypothetical protein [Bryobacteraceae bacterium]